MLKMTRGLPSIVRVDNGPELISAALDTWCKGNNIMLVFIQPGKPMQNGYVEPYNGSIKRELLNAYLFQTLDEVRYQAKIWRQDYNQQLPP